MANSDDLEKAQNEVEKAQNEYLNFARNHPESLQKWWKTMTDAQTEMFYLIECNATNIQMEANINSIRFRAKGRLLTPEEIVAVLNYLHAVDQRCSSYQPTANALSTRGHPRLSQHLTQVQQDIHQAITLYSDMYRSAGEIRSNWKNMPLDTAAEVTKGLLESTLEAQRIRDQVFRRQTLINQGVPYEMADLISRGFIWQVT